MPVKGFLLHRTILRRKECYCLFIMEFMPIEEYGKKHPETLGLEDVEPGKNYALIISTNGGLWRYLLGDTIQFTSLQPYRIRVSGRLKHYMNAFGEEVIIDNADK